MRPAHTVADILEIEQDQLQKLSLTSWHFRALQATLAGQEIVLTLPREPLLHRQCPSCKKGTLHSVLLFDGRGPPQNWPQLFKDESRFIDA
jgi:hypothetical protein